MRKMIWTIRRATIRIAIAAAAFAFTPFGGDDGDIAGGLAAGWSRTGLGFAKQTKGQKTENLLKGGLLGGFGSVGAKRFAVTILGGALTATIVGPAPSFSLRSLGI
jgi:hypothetical protein